MTGHDIASLIVPSIIVLAVFGAIALIRAVIRTINQVSRGDF